MRSLLIVTLLAIECFPPFTHAFFLNPSTRNLKTFNILLASERDKVPISAYASSSSKDSNSLTTAPSTTSQPLPSSRVVQVAEDGGTLFAPETILEGANLLQDATRSFNTTSASQLLSILSDMRVNGTDPMSVALYLDRLLVQGPDRKLPFWARVRPLARYSKRARLMSLRRTLDLTTPPPNTDDEETEDTLEDQMRRRRRALISLLRQLENSGPDASGSYSNKYDNQDALENFKGPAIRYIEKKAVREYKLSRQRSSNDEDMTKRRPADLETPEYKVVAKRPSTGVEIRHYEPFSVCTVAMGQPRPLEAYKTDAIVSDPNMSNARAFGALAGYLFGKNQKQEAMKMTTPVLTRPIVQRVEGDTVAVVGDGDKGIVVNGKESSKLMSFVLPSDYWKEGLSLAPPPLKGSGVTIEEISGGDRAVVMFGGYASTRENKVKKQQLLDALKKDKEWEVIKDETVALAQYNDPFTPPWKRLNEVSVAVKRRKQ